MTQPLTDFLNSLLSQIYSTVSPIIIGVLIGVFGCLITIWAVRFIYNKIVGLFWTKGVDDWGRPYYHNKLTGHGWDAHGEY